MKNLIIKHWQEIFLAFFVVIALVLRFANITELNFFTFDQSRDALFVKRIIVDKEFRLLGTQTSLPGMYLPPFYYYTIAPILWLFRLNPIGIDIYAACIGVLSIPAVFVVANKLFCRPAGVFSAGLWAVSPLMVELTRRAWNPNTLPFFILIAFYFLYQYYLQRKTRDFLLGFGFYGYSLSLHFGAWTLLPLLAFTFVFYALKNKKIPGVLASACLVVFFVSPLLLFELRHNFFLFSQAKSFFLEEGRVGASLWLLPQRMVTSFLALFTILLSGKATVGYGAPLGFAGNLKEFFTLSQPISVVAQKPYSFSFLWWGLAIVALIIWVSFKGKNKLAVKLTWIWLLWGILASWLYQGGLHFFYYLYLFPIPFLLFGYLGSFLYTQKAKVLKFLVLVVFLAVVGIHLKNTVAFSSTWRSGSDLKSVAQIIAQNVPGGSSFNIATIQRDLDRWDRAGVDYRYFTEAFGGKRALDWFPEDYQRAETLFVIDETGEADVLNSPVMEIQAFSPAKVVNYWKTDNGIVIYQLAKQTVEEND